ncbi:hypothetical protein TTHERM_00015990 (macronuclear) [Tetrahymena thermophila SB210]|uniref:Uncharacterized protein n=1 Tax=Tetrahymena thermophila (strain SB210) TaxID=312017 RepID=Q22RI8_TETTS|nr:hypothetical protein TTHERM_00015990 [Tetrahymena thermophila SB210]EAR88134.1 hypothetical protein TTHERM_00015990 [Tetrahymena thermophila SB210]|eukprot:XP_001008379.1 hypothetical protein TTHERM_00015990 [Tetrahymena thermophila SB210]
MIESNQQEIYLNQEYKDIDQHQNKMINSQITNFDSLFKDMLFPQLNSTQKSQFANENQKWWFKQQYAFGMLRYQDQEIIKISLYKDFNPQTDIQMCFKDINNIIYKITLTPTIYLLPFEKDLILVSNDSEYVASNIEIFGNGAFEISRGIQIALATKRLTIQDIEEMIESSILQEHSNSIQLFKEITPAL